MRASTARLSNSPVRLADLRFPQVTTLVHRTRLAFIHLDNLLAFAKRDRDGRVDGYLTAHLPDECLLVFLKRGEAVNAASLHVGGRQVITINEALRRMRAEVERGELAYCAAPLEQLAWMYESCAGRLEARFVDPTQPEALFPALQQENASGVLEFISNGRVSYVRLEDGRFAGGYWCDKPATAPVGDYVASLFALGADGRAPALSSGLFPYVADLPAQAPIALVKTYRELLWRITDAVDAEFPGDGKKRAARAADGMRATVPAIALLTVPREQDVPEAVVQPEELASALADWTRRVLEGVEVMMPGAAVKVLREATREHRYVLQAAGYYAALPWPVTW